MGRFAAGNDASLGDVYDLASPAIFTFLLRVCRDRSLAEDLTQETFIRVHKARGLFRHGAAVMPWLYAIARRLFLDALRRRSSEHLLTIALGTGDIELHSKSAHGRCEPSPEDLLSDRELARAVDDALAMIPESHASAFRLLKGEGLSVAETAAVMGTTREAIKVRAHRAYVALRALLRDRVAACNPTDLERRGA